MKKSVKSQNPYENFSGDLLILSMNFLCGKHGNHRIIRLLYI